MLKHLFLLNRQSPTATAPSPRQTTKIVGWPNVQVSLRPVHKLCGNGTISLVGDSTIPCRSLSKQGVLASKVGPQTRQKPFVCGVHEIGTHDFPEKQTPERLDNVGQTCFNCTQGLDNLDANLIRSPCQDHQLDEITLPPINIPNFYLCSLIKTIFS